MSTPARRWTNAELAERYRGFLLRRRGRTILRNDAEAGDVRDTFTDATGRFLPPGHPSVDREARAAALRMLHELTEPEDEVSILAYVDGVSHTDIASILGLSRPTIWKRLIAVRERAARVFEGVT